MKPGNLFTELKRRNVIRAAAFYAASAWLLVQVATQVFPFFHIAEWVVRWVVVAACIGISFRDGVFVVLRMDVARPPCSKVKFAPNESITRQTGRKLDRWIIAILGMAVDFVARQSIRPPSRREQDGRWSIGGETDSGQINCRPALRRPFA